MQTVKTWVKIIERVKIIEIQVIDAFTFYEKIHILLCYYFSILAFTQV